MGMEAAKTRNSFTGGYITFEKRKYINILFVFENEMLTVVEIFNQSINQSTFICFEPCNNQLAPKVLLHQMTNKSMS